VRVLAGTCIHPHAVELQRHPPGVSDGVIMELRSVLHAAARLVTGVRRNEHITPTLLGVVQWLPVKQRITYKIAVMAFSSGRGTYTVYSSDICTPVEALAELGN
jgi:hypothetical protein